MSSTEQNNRQVKRIAITGMGIISALGDNQVQNLDSLLQVRSGISNLDNIASIHSTRLKFGEIKRSNKELADKLNLPKNHNYSRTAMLGVISAKEAVKDSGVLDMNEYTTALISATSVGGMDMSERYWGTFKDKPETQRFIPSHYAADSTQKIADSLGITDLVTTISTACSSATNAIMLGARLINSGRIERAVVGGTDALCKFTINGFNSLMILSEGHCKPFDENRTGLNLGEGAAYLVLESETIVREKNKTVLGYISGYGNANDAFHQTASSENGEGAYLAMKRAMETASMDIKVIDYINAHGTATPNNDLSESIAIKRLFGDEVPDFSSTKAYTGHTLASAGALEAVFSLYSLQGNVIFPNLNFSESISQTGLTPITSLKPKNLKHILSNSFGFGGNCSSLVISKA